MNTLHNWDTWIGTDEAGKGDYFGPLVVAAAYVDAACCEAFTRFGVTDGKILSKQRIRNLARLIRHRYEQQVVVIAKMPPAYNTLYKRFNKCGQNLNNLLASLHAEAIHTLASRVDAKHVLVDRFSRNDLITPQLIKRAGSEPQLQPGTTPTLTSLLPPQATLGIKIMQITKAERDIAVAAASILARDVFLTEMETLSRNYGIRLPRGAYQVVETGRAFVALHGKDALEKVAKLHFNLTDAVLAPQAAALS